MPTLQLCDHIDFKATNDHNLIWGTTIIASVLLLTVAIIVIVYLTTD